MSCTPGRGASLPVTKVPKHTSSELVCCRSTTPQAIWSRLVIVRPFKAHSFLGGLGCPKLTSTELRKSVTGCISLGNRGKWHGFAPARYSSQKSMHSARERAYETQELYFSPCLYGSFTSYASPSSFMSSITETASIMACLPSILQYSWPYWFGR